MMIEVYRARARGLLGESAALGNLAHAHVMGSAREILLRNVIDPLLPPQTQTLTGSIINSNNTSRIARNQDDIVLFNTTRAPLLWSAPGCALIPIEGVVGQ